MHEVRYSGHRGKPKHLSECGCESCLIWLPPPFKFSSGWWKTPHESAENLYEQNWSGKCDLCGTSKWGIVHVPQDVSDFLKTKNICSSCRSRIDRKFKEKLMCCWGSSPASLVQLAILMVLRDNLSFVVNRPRYYNYCKTKYGVS